VTSTITACNSKLAGWVSADCRNHRLTEELVVPESKHRVVGLTRCWAIPRATWVQSKEQLVRCRHFWLLATLRPGIFLELNSLLSCSPAGLLYSTSPLENNISGRNPKACETKAGNEPGN
jgi:hypothetical protein